MDIDEQLRQELVLQGLHIKKLREERNFTLKDVSLKTGIRTQYLRKIEQGSASRVMVVKHLLKIATVFQIKLFELFEYK